MLRDIISLFLNKWKLKKYIQYIQGFRNKEKYMRCQSKQKIFLMMTPNYGNIGDHAITIGTKQYLQDYFSEYEIIEIGLKQTYREMRAVELACNNCDIIILQGGGNLGNLYQYIEDCRRFIIKHLHNRKIVSMPVTVTFTNDIDGKRQIKKSKNIYRKCTDLTIIGREKFSYQYLQKEFLNCNIILNPDMAFYIKKPELINKFDRNGIMLCIRHDKESINKNIDKFIREMYETFTYVKVYDTETVREISNELRSIEVWMAMEEFARSEFVITDRMHAMILCAITGTSCIATKSLDWKVLGSYQWIKHLNYIRLIDSLNVATVKEQMLELGNMEKDVLPEFDKTYFNLLREKICKK